MVTQNPPNVNVTQSLFLGNELNKVDFKEIESVVYD